METDFNWVGARASCLLVGVFEQLKLDVEKDIQVRNSQIPAGKEIRFRLLLNGDNFFVLVAGWDIGNHSVKFVLTDSAIIVRDAEDINVLIASVTLSNDGKCRLLVAGQELELWQFRKTALDELFFRSPFLK
jgi:hypothetical protein